MIAEAILIAILAGFLLIGGIDGFRRIALEGYESTATILNGPNAGRSGKYWGILPFDLWVTINVAANEEEKQKLIEDYLARDVGWKMPGPDTKYGEDVVIHTRHARVHIGAWRWNVKIERTKICN